jgi:hypothetical protein
MHHQRQVVLRNSTTPESAFAMLVKMFWAWSIRVNRRARTEGGGIAGLLGLLVPATLAGVSLVVFTVAGSWANFLFLVLLGSWVSVQLL